MQGFNGLDAVGQGGDLADHVHAIAMLIFIANRDDLARGIAIHAFASNTQAAQVQVFEHFGDLTGRRALGDQAAPGVEKLACKAGIGAAAGVPRAGGQADRALAGHGFRLEARHDGAGLDNVLGE